MGKTQGYGELRRGSTYYSVHDFRTEARFLDPRPSWRLPVPDQKANATNEGDVIKHPPQITSDVHPPPPGFLTPACQRSSKTQELAFSELERLRAFIQPTRQALLDHRIYCQIRGLDGLRLFMEHHVFAVWDFMSLLKALQQRICCVDVPWIPSSTSFTCRLVNEIVLGEESGEDGEGGYARHFER